MVAIISTLKALIVKKWVSVTRNYFHLVEMGDASIHKAAKQASITNIKYVDTKICKVYVPICFIPIAVKETSGI